MNSVNIPLKTADCCGGLLKSGIFVVLKHTDRAPPARQGDYHSAPFVNNCKEHVMLQANEIQQRFTHIQQTVGEAEQACQKSQDTPNEIRDCIKKISREVQQAQSVMQSNDQQRIIQCVDSLEDMGDEAKRISRSLPQMPADVEQAVTRVHAELSQLKHQLH
jgi:methyl-accepting chemotaxis protein